MTVHYTAPKRLRRYAVQGSLFEQLTLESPRQRWIREQSEARYERFTGHPPQRFPGELGYYQGMRIITDAGR